MSVRWIIEDLEEKVSSLKKENAALHQQLTEMTSLFSCKMLKEVDNMDERNPSYSASATAGLNVGISGKINLDYGGDTGKIKYLYRTEKVDALIKKIIQIEHALMRGEFGYDPDIAEKKVIAEIENAIKAAV